MNFDSLTALFYRPEFLRKQEFHSGQALRFYTLTILIFSIACALVFIPRATSFLSQLRDDQGAKQKAVIENLYPSGLVVTVKDGIVSTNAIEPVSIAVPSLWNPGTSSFPSNLLVIDTTAPITASSFEALDTLAILGQDEVGFRDNESGGVRIVALRDREGRPLSFTVTEKDFTFVVNKAFSVIEKVSAAFLLFAPFIMFVGLWIGYLVYTLFGALVVWAASNFRGYKLGYGRAYLSALYLLPLPFLVQWLTMLSHGGFGGRIPFLFSLVLFLAAFFNFPKVAKVEGSDNALVTP